MAAAIAPKPPLTFRGVVEQFKINEPSYVTMRDETAYFMQVLGYDPSDPKYGFIDSIGRRQRQRMRDQPLYALYERVLGKLGKDLSASEIAEIERVYEEASKHLTTHVKLEDEEEETAPLRPIPLTPAPPLEDDDRDRSPPIGRSSAPSRSSFLDKLPHLQRITGARDDRGANRFSTSPSPDLMDRARNFLSRSKEREMY